MSTAPVNDAFVELVQQNSGIIYKICNAYCANRSDREDLAQEIIYQLWKAGKSFDAQYKFTTWMYRVALNTAISFYRTGSRKTNTVALHETGFDVEDKTPGENNLEENITLLQKCISELKELDRALMILYLEAKSYSEIAEITGLTETNVATRINRAKEKLKQKFLHYNKL